jgi:hypothetical protein
VAQTHATTAESHYVVSRGGFGGIDVEDGDKHIIAGGFDAQDNEQAFALALVGQGTDEPDASRRWSKHFETKSLGIRDILYACK